MTLNRLLPQTIEYYGGPFDGRIWRRDPDVGDIVGWPARENLIPLGKVMHVYDLIGHRYYYREALPITPVDINDMKGGA